AWSTKPVCVIFTHGVPFLLLFDLVNLISAEVATFIQVRHTPDLVITLEFITQGLGAIFPILG
ncbi:MAG: hypothetical protein ACXWAS_17710, partial [Methylobacter sp.]